MKRTSKKTPVRSSLEGASSLQSKVNDGIGALESGHHKHLAEDIRKAFGDSLDLDKAMVEGHEQENRWDYLLGHSRSKTVIGLEVHSAQKDQITNVIKKKEAARDQLRGHLKQGKSVADWLWVASGKVQFANTEKARRRLDQKGIRFVGRRVEKKHLPETRATKAGRPDPGKRPQ